MKTLVLSLCAAAMVMSSFGCRRNPAHPGEGPMERAGKKIDDAAETVKDDSKAAAKRVKEDAKDAKDALKK